MNSTFCAGGNGADMLKSVPALPSAATSTSGSTLKLDRRQAKQAIGGALLQMMLPALLKMSSAAARKTLQDTQVRCMLYL